MPRKPRELGNVARAGLNGISEMADSNDRLLKEIAVSVRDGNAERALYLIGDTRRNNTMIIAIAELLLAGKLDEAAALTRKLIGDE